MNMTRPNASILPAAHSLLSWKADVQWCCAVPLVIGASSLEAWYSSHGDQMATDLVNLARVMEAVGDLPAARANVERALGIDEAAMARVTQRWPPIWSTSHAYCESSVT
jgi:hypothetical protein